MKINVTEEHIRKGVVDSRVFHSCPVGLAIKDTPGCEHVDPGMLQPGVEYPASVWKFVNAFDRGEPVQPFTFELPLDAAEEAGRW